MKRKVRKKITFYLHRFVDVHICLPRFFSSLLSVACLTNVNMLLLLLLLLLMTLPPLPLPLLLLTVLLLSPKLSTQMEQKPPLPYCIVVHSMYIIVYADLSYQLDQLTWFIWTHANSVDKLHKCLSTSIQQTIYFKSDGKINGSLKTKSFVCYFSFHSFFIS